MRIPIMAAVLAGAGLIAAGCGSSGEAGTQASTVGQDPCEAAVADVYRIADANKTSTDTTEMGLASVVAFAACKTPQAVDDAINVWLADARAAGNTEVDAPSAAAAASTRRVMCSSIAGEKPVRFCP